MQCLKNNFTTCSFCFYRHQQLEAEKAALIQEFREISSELQDSLKKIKKLLVRVRGAAREKRLGMILALFYTFMIFTINPFRGKALPLLMR